MLENLESYPEGTVFMEVDYDTETALRAEYGVTLQYTFVAVDESGNVFDKITTSSTDAVRELSEELMAE